MELGGLGKLAASRAQNNLNAGRISRVSKAAQAAGEGENAEAAQAAHEMESLFATMMVTEMRKGLGEGFFGSGPGADTFGGWFDEQLGASIAERGSLGLAEQIKESIIREQEAAQAEELRRAAEGKTE